ncbi:MAG: ABC transporter permease [Acidimicrobiia bacterium]|nr:ABC transporter permease [Acidimicrobiia bacterium]NNK90974.1 ABC transporter permease [Acidimicrobiia bacterium]
MGAYITRRLVYGVVTLIALSIIVFGLMHLAGDPLQRLKFNPRLTDEYKNQVTAFYGLDQSFWIQYWKWLTGFVTFDWGISFQGTQEVSELVLGRIPATIRLGVTALLMAITIGIPLGIYQAIRQYSFFDQLGTTAAFIGFSTPVFVIGVVLQVLLALKLEQWTGVKFFYVVGMNDSSYADLTALAKAGDVFRHLFLPATTIAILSIAGYSRFQRASMLEVLHSDYLRTAKAKGLPRRRVIAKHALRNALIPVVTLISLDIAGLVGGAIITETIFGWPGVGRLYITAINQVDTPVVMAVVMVIGIGIVFMNLVADIVYGFLDPRVRYD